MHEERARLWLQQTEHSRGHLWPRLIFHGSHESINKPNRHVQTWIKHGEKHYTRKITRQKIKINITNESRNTTMKRYNTEIGFNSGFIVGSVLPIFTVLFVFVSCLVCPVLPISLNCKYKYLPARSVLSAIFEGLRTPNTWGIRTSCVLTSWSEVSDLYYSFTFCSMKNGV